MSAADDLRRATIDEHERYRATIADLDQATLETEPVLGFWPIRDLTDHLTGWIDTLLATAADGLGGPARERLPITDFDAFNATSVATDRDKDWPAVITDLDAAVERAANQVAALTEDQLSVVMDFPWRQRDAISMLLGVIRRHHHEHREDVERWLAARDA